MVKTSYFKLGRMKQGLQIPGEEDENRNINEFFF